MNEERKPVLNGELGPLLNEEQGREEVQPSPFPHPPWTVGVVVVLGVASLLFGLLARPIFLAVGSPFIIALLLWLYVKLFTDGSSS